MWIKEIPVLLMGSVDINMLQAIIRKKMKALLLTFLTFLMFSTNSLSQTKDVLKKIEKIYNQGDVINYFSGDNDGGYFLGYDNGVSNAYLSSSNATKYIKKIYDNDQNIKSVAFTPKGDGWVIIYGKSGYWEYNIPYSLKTQLKELNRNGNEINFVQFANTGGWIVVFDGGYSFSYKNFPKNAGNTVSKQSNKGHKIKSISFTTLGGWILIYGTNGWVSYDVPEFSLNALRKIKGKNLEIYNLSFTEFSEYVILHEEGISYSFMNEYQINNYQNALTEYASWSTIDINNLALNDGRVLLPCINIEGDNILTIESVHIRDNGEHSSRDPAALGIEIYLSNDAENWYICYGIPLIGLHNEGAEEKGGEDTPNLNGMTMKQ